MGTSTSIRTHSAIDEDLERSFAIYDYCYFRKQVLLDDAKGKAMHQCMWQASHVGANVKYSERLQYCKDEIIKCKVEHGKWDLCRLLPM